MYYKLWKELKKLLEEKDPENEVLCLMDILERKEENEENINKLINEILK